MRDPLSWSLPIGTVFGITIRVHLLFPLIALSLILRAAFREGMPADTWLHASGLMVILFVAVLLHEFGHCFAARSVEGEADEILIWPLGGLAYCEVPHNARANFITAVGGPIVNILLCLASGGLLAYLQVHPPLNPWWDPYGDPLFGLDSSPLEVSPWIIWLARFFYINWILTLLNLCLVGFPMDMGRIFQSILWPRFGYAQATRAAIFAGFITALVVGVYAIARESVLALCLMLFIYQTCRQQWLVLEHGGDDSLLGYDFSQGYTSLEKEAPPRRRQPNFFQRWLKRRAEKKRLREEAQREAEERRMDELLEKVQREGLQALSEEEKRFLTRVSARYRNNR